MLLESVICILPVELPVPVPWLLIVRLFVNRVPELLTASVVPEPLKGAAAELVMTIDELPDVVSRVAPVGLTNCGVMTLIEWEASRRLSAVLITAVPAVAVMEKGGDDVEVA